MKVDRSAVKAVLVALGALAYGVSPVDVIPDFLPAIGLGDDAVVLVTAAVAILRIVMKARGLRLRDAPGRATMGS